MTRIESIDLAKDKIPDLSYAYLINERGYGIATDNPPCSFLVTYGLYTCKGIVFSQPELRRGLVCHMSVVESLSKVINGLVSRFSPDLASTDVYIVHGERQATYNKYRTNSWPTLDQLVEAVSEFNPRRVLVDNNRGQIRGIALNLADGELKEINRSPWTESRSKYISINRSIDELE